MIRLKEIDTRSADYAYVERLLTEAFPVDERRDTDEQRHYTDHNPAFHCCVLIDDDDVKVGLLNFWDFGEFRYIEHFAIDPARRCRGLGQTSLGTFLSHEDKPVILEVERPDCEMAARRIDFYQRQGLTLWEDKDYIQPAYRIGGNEVPMLLMASPSIDKESEYNHIVKTIHNQVYNA